MRIRFRLYRSCGFDRVAAIAYASRAIDLFVVVCQACAVAIALWLLLVGVLSL